MTETAWLHFRIDKELYERLRKAAVADRRSIANWVAVTCEHALDARDVEDARSGALR